LECECIREQVRNNGAEAESRTPSENGDGTKSLKNGDKTKGDSGDEAGEEDSDSDSEPSFMVASQYNGKAVSRPSLCTEKYALIRDSDRTKNELLR